MSTFDDSGFVSKYGFTDELLVHLERTGLTFVGCLDMILNISGTEPTQPIILDGISYYNDISTPGNRAAKQYRISELFMASGQQKKESDVEVKTLEAAKRKLEVEKQAIEDEKKVAMGRKMLILRQHNWIDEELKRYGGKKIRGQPKRKMPAVPDSDEEAIHPAKHRLRPSKSLQSDAKQDEDTETGLNIKAELKIKKEKEKWEIRDIQSPIFRNRTVHKFSHGVAQQQKRLACEQPEAHPLTPTSISKAKPLKTKKAIIRRPVPLIELQDIFPLPDFKGPWSIKCLHHRWEENGYHGQSIAQEVLEGRMLLQEHDGAPIGDYTPPSANDITKSAQNSSDIVLSQMNEASKGGGADIVEISAKPNFHAQNDRLITRDTLSTHVESGQLAIPAMCSDTHPRLQAKQQSPPCPVICADGKLAEGTTEFDDPLRRAILPAVERLASSGVGIGIKTEKNSDHSIYESTKQDDSSSCIALPANKAQNMHHTQGSQSGWESFDDEFNGGNSDAFEEDFYDPDETSDSSDSSLSDSGESSEDCDASRVDMMGQWKARRGR